MVHEKPPLIIIILFRLEKQLVLSVNLLSEHQHSGAVISRVSELNQQISTDSIGERRTH
jgi:hypothetical protein